MAAIRRRPGPVLRLLTAASLGLPGLAPTPARAAEDDQFTFQYGDYEESARNLYGVSSDYHPIRADSLQTSWRLTLEDRLKLNLTWAQDTWSGATPIATAPRAFHGNRPTSPDGVSGATPFIEGDLFLNGDLQPLEVNAFGEVRAPDDQLVHTMSSASPESRDELDLDLAWEFDDARLGFGTGFSYEDDYRAAFARANGTLHFDQQRTTVDLALSYAWGRTDALLDHDAVPYIDTSLYGDEVSVEAGSGDRVLRANRDDFGVDVGVTRVLSKDALVEARVGFKHSAGYLANPYKVVEVGFIDPAQQFLAPPGGFYAQVHALLEERPSQRDQWTFELRHVRFFETFDASLHLAYRFFHDDWGIDANTLEASWDQPLPGGWLVTPRVRYYSQSKADFYTPYLISRQAYVSVVSDPDTGEILSITRFDPRLLPRDYSSDWRLSGFGTLAGGLAVSKVFAPGVRLQGDFEYYAHKSSLKLGGGGSGSYTDFHAYTVSAALVLDARALHAFAYAPQGEPAEPHVHRGGRAPAGLTTAHMLPRAGDVMAGLRYAWSRESGDWLHGSYSVNEATVGAAACDGPCRTEPRRMTMNMVMLDLMFAPTDWLSLMVMPQFVGMKMDVVPVAGAPADLHGAHAHTSGGTGDIETHALVRLFDDETHHLHMGVGLNVPTGSVDLQFRRTHQEDRGFMDYGMQLGSGTWDLLPSATYTGRRDAWSWGAQVSGVHRLESENDSGYALGDALQATAWLGYGVTSWLEVSLRGIYTRQGGIRGEYDANHDDSGPMDFPANYGGRYWDAAFGINLIAPGHFLAGNSLGVEWAQPLQDDVKGYQLERRGTLFVRWGVDF